jgi:outer membrane protein assembly factor BamA
MNQVLLVMKVAFFLALIQSSYGYADRGYKRIAAVEFTGNRIFDQATLQKELRTITVGGRVTSGTIESDIEINLKAFLKQHGYMQCEITYEELPLADEDVKLRIRISEGPQFRLANLDFRGMTFFVERGISSQFYLRPGEIVNFSEIKSGLERVQRMYSNLGFINWSYVPEQSFDELNQTMSLTFTICEGVRHRIGIVAFVGCHDQAEEDRLRAQTDLQPGDVFSPQKLSLVALQLKKFGVVKESTAILDETQGIVGIVFWLKPASIN